MDKYTVEYEPGDFAASELQKGCDGAVAALHADSDALAAAAADLGVSVSELRELKVEIGEGSAGIEPISTAIFIAFSGAVAKKAGEAFWDQILAPKLKRTMGGKPVGREVESESGSDNEPAPKAP